MRRVVLALLAPAVIAGCAWDGPSIQAGAAQAPPVDDSSTGVAVAPTLPVVVEPSTSTVPSDLGAVPDGRPDGAIDLESIELPDVIGVVGDSLTVSAADEITTALLDRGAETVVVDAIERRRMVSRSRDVTSGVSAVADLAPQAPDIWVIALGTNDVGSERFTDDLVALLEELPPGAALVWVDLFIRDRGDEVAEANSVLERTLARRPSTVIVDWSGHGTDDTLIAGDGIHLTDAGQVEFAEVIAQGVAQLAAR